MSLGALGDDKFTSPIVGIHESMPCLDSVTFQFKFEDYNRIVSVPKVCTQGWKKVVIYSADPMGPQFSTLCWSILRDLFEVSVRVTRYGIGFIRVLKACPHLRKPDAIHVADIDIDRVLERVLVLPSHLLFHGLGSRLRGSSALALHKLTRVSHYPLPVSAAIKIMSTLTPECVGLRLETGLDKLGGLKELEDLHMIDIWHQMGVGVGVQETEWMLQQWLML
ncbi:hypothetical protein BG000_009094, partial [Podila horticola]